MDVVPDEVPGSAIEHARAGAYKPATRFFAGRDSTHPLIPPFKDQNPSYLGSVGRAQLHTQDNTQAVRMFTVQNTTAEMCAHKFRSRAYQGHIVIDTHTCITARL